MPDIICSTQDLASQTIFQQLISNYDFDKTNEKFEDNSIYTKDQVKLITTNKRLIYSEHLDILNSDLLIFASRHKSESGKPSLLVHCTGNWNDKAEFGGRPREIAMSSGSTIKIALIELKKQKMELHLDRFDVNLEVTHHGPTQLETPLVFIELGSTPEDWKDANGALAVAHAIMRVAESKDTFRNFIGIGGPHYAQKFSSLVINPNLDFTLSHIIPKYIIDFIDKEMLIKCIRRSKEPVEGFVLDWKGLNSHQRYKLINIIELLRYDYKRIRDFKIPHI
ncbi:MAG: D-aminoacyl-tRNA deacylase [Candidatus Helarchaeota archaeon]